jgi:hypothetical protein
VLRYPRFVGPPRNTPGKDGLEGAIIIQSMTQRPTEIRGIAIINTLALHRTASLSSLQTYTPPPFLAQMSWPCFCLVCWICKPSRSRVARCRIHKWDISVTLPPSRLHVILGVGFCHIRFGGGDGTSGMQKKNPPFRFAAYSVVTVTVDTSRQTHSTHTLTTQTHSHTHPPLRPSCLHPPVKLPYSCQ